MPAIVPKSVLEEIRLRCDIADVIGSYFRLQKSGAAFKALCPFHKEKTPSFHVNPQRQIFHCFGCGAGGDVFKFVMLYESVDFMTAVRILAERAGITLRLEPQGSGPAVDKAALYALHEAVAALYQETLRNSSEAAAARAYLAQRQLPPEIVQGFGLGYAPDRWDFLINWAPQRGYSLAQLEAAGLVVRSETANSKARVYDRFRGRLMFPIRNEQGRVVAFSGRALGSEDQTAKYVNSPETPLFRKSHVLYALDRARHAMAERREAILCEGQIDVIRCHQAGFTTAVAAQGTAFTEDHARILKRYADGVVLLFDGDEAGRNAALRALGVFLQAGLAVRVAALPDGEDPDSFLVRHGAAAMQKILDAARPALEFQIDLLIRREQPAQESSLIRITRAVLETIAQSPNAVQRDLLVHQAAQRLHVAPTALSAELARLLRRRESPAASTTPAAPTPRQPPEELALAEHLAAAPHLAGLVREFLPLALLTDPLCRALIEAVLAAEASGTELMTVIAGRDDENRQLSTFAARVLEAPAKVGPESSPEMAVQSLILKLWRIELQRRRRALEQQAATAPPEERDRLLAGATYKQLTHHLSEFRHWERAAEIIRSLYLH